MTWEIALVLGILFVALILFITEVLRMDVVALLVLGVLAVSGLVDPDEALSGFSNPAVITVWAMFILSAGLTETGVAAIIGQQVLKMAGKTEFRMIIVIMITSGVLSAFMNNIGVAAFMLPVVITVARKTGVAPSRLLMPLAFGSLLGGLTTLIGTPPNLLISNGLREAGYEAFTIGARRSASTGHGSIRIRLRALPIWKVSSGRCAGPTGRRRPGRSSRAFAPTREKRWCWTRTSSSNGFCQGPSFAK